MTTEQAKQVLREAGYYVDNLWHVNDVMNRFKCNESDAEGVLDYALRSEWLVDMTFEIIMNFATESGLEEKEVSNG